VGFPLCKSASCVTFDKLDDCTKVGCMYVFYFRYMSEDMLSNVKLLNRTHQPKALTILRPISALKCTETGVSMVERRFEGRKMLGLEGL